jgi:hypothetical protein
MNAVSLLRNRARHSFTLVLLHTILRGRNPRDHVVQRGLTRICIEGYPRSANTWAVLMFRQANETLHIAHHTHSTANISRALRYGIPTVVPIRNPIDAVTSAVVGKNRQDVDGGISYYGWVEPRVDSLVVAEFEEVTRDFNLVIGRVNLKYGTSFEYIADIETAASRVKQLIRSKVRERGIDALRKEAIPNLERERLKERVQPLVSRHRHTSQAQALYARLINSSNTDERVSSR